MSREAGLVLGASAVLRCPLAGTRVPFPHLLGGNPAGPRLPCPRGFCLPSGMKDAPSPLRQDRRGLGSWEREEMTLRCRPLLGSGGSLQWAAPAAQGQAVRGCGQRGAREGWPLPPCTASREPASEGSTRLAVGSQGAPRLGPGSRLGEGERTREPGLQLSVHLSPGAGSARLTPPPPRLGRGQGLGGPGVGSEQRPPLSAHLQDRLAFNGQAPTEGPGQDGRMAWPEDPESLSSWGARGWEG